MEGIVVSSLIKKVVGVAWSSTRDTESNEQFELRKDEHQNADTLGPSVSICQGESVCSLNQKDLVSRKKV